MIVGASFLHLVPRLGSRGKEIFDWFCYAPGIDLALAYFMLMPLTIGILALGWQGLGIALLAELTALWLWIIFHELAHRQKHQAKIHLSIYRLLNIYTIRNINF